MADNLIYYFMKDNFEIPLSKKKLVLFLIAGVVFVTVGYLGAVKPEDFVSPVFRSPEVIRISGILGVCFFGIGIFFIAKKLFDKSSGLIIDQNGITNNTNVTNMGLIEWEDITYIEKRQVMSTKFLILHTDNPQKYLKRAKNIISRQAMNMNYKTYGSPISITANSLKINFDDLRKLLISQFKKNKKQV